MNAAISVRYSSESQRETSLEDQERLCRQEADRLGYQVARVYRDAALSGQLSEQRPGFVSMMAAAKRREFDVLIVDDASRLSRDSADALRLLQRLEFWGIGLIARTDGINTVQNAKGARLPYAIKSAFNEEFLRDLGEKTWRGQEGRVRAGLAPEVYLTATGANLSLAAGERSTATGGSSTNLRRRLSVGSFGCSSGTRVAVPIRLGRSRSY